MGMFIWSVLKFAVYIFCRNEGEENNNQKAILDHPRINCSWRNHTARWVNIKFALLLFTPQLKQLVESVKRLCCTVISPRLLSLSARTIGATFLRAFSLAHGIYRWWIARSISTLSQCCWWKPPRLLRAEHGPRRNNVIKLYHISDQNHVVLIAITFITGFLILQENIVQATRRVHSVPRRLSRVIAVSRIKK